MASVKPRPGYGYEVRYVDPTTGKRPSKTFKLKKDAEAFKRKVEREIEDGLHVTDASAATVDKVAKEYLAHNEARVRDGRITEARLDNIARALRCHIIPAFGDKPIRDVSLEAVDNFYRAMTARGLAPTYARAQVKEFNMMEQFAFKRHYTRSRQVQAALSDLRGIAHPRIRTLSTEQSAAILRGVLKHRTKSNPRVEARTACMVHLGACCGFRLGELLALKVKHVLLDAGVVEVRHSMTQKGEVKGPKSAAGRRDVPLPSHLVAMLRDWMLRYFIPNDEGLIFTERDGRRCSHSMINKNWGRALADVGLHDPEDNFHFHALRHFAGSWWIANGMTIPDVSRNLGHADPATTMRIYVHSLTSASNRAAAIEGPAAALMALADAQKPVTLTHL